MSDLNPFGPQDLEILLALVRDRDAAVVLRHEPGNVREQLAGLEAKLTAQLAQPSIRAAIAEDIRLGRTSQSIRDEIIGKVGMMAYSRTPEMQARYDAAVARERGLKHKDKTSLCVTITGPQGSGTLLARAILELLQETAVACSMPEEVENPYDGDSIVQLGKLRDTRVIVQTSSVE